MNDFHRQNIYISIRLHVCNQIQNLAICKSHSMIFPSHILHNYACTAVVISLGYSSLTALSVLYTL